MATQQEHIDFIKAAYAGVQQAMAEARAAQDAYRAVLAAASAEGVNAQPENPMQLLIQNEEPLEIFTRARLFKAEPPREPPREEVTDVQPGI